MTPGFIAYKNSTIQYYRHAGGPELLVCFHGYGENAITFTSLAEQLSPQYSIIALNLPWHGDTHWKEGLDFNITDLEAIINLVPDMTTHFSIAGYSMGGRVALHLYQHLHQRINRMLLIAPDGLRMNGWYWLATQSRLGNRLFRHVVEKPGTFFFVTKVFRQLGLINTGVYNFSRNFLLQESARRELYTIWTTMRNIRPAVKNIEHLLTTNNTPVTMIYGQYDKVIRYPTGQAFARKAGKSVSVHVLATGHKLLQKKSIPNIAALFAPQ